MLCGFKTCFSFWLFIIQHFHFVGVPGELEVLEDVNEQECIDCALKHPDKIIGIKIRLVANISNEGKHEEEAYRY